MVAKLSSVRVMSAAPFATSVPVIPIAQPMSAAFSAGASLTPSPVMATTWPFRCHAFTIRILFSGDTRAYTAMCSIWLSSSASVSVSSVAPVMALSESSRMPRALAMAEAVTIWSPVIMTGLMPALRQVATAALASGRGGSIMPSRPKKVRLCSNPSGVIDSGI